MRRDTMPYDKEVRNNDEAFEKLLAAWLDSHLYDKWKRMASPKGEVFDFERIHNCEEQIRGTDVVLVCRNAQNKYKIHIDEKAAAHYINSDLPTFVLEVSFLNRNNTEQIGWLFRNDLDTNLYYFMWIYVDESKFPYKYPKGRKKQKTQYFREVQLTDIKVVQIVSVERTKLHEYLENQGITLQSSLKIAEEMRTNERPFEIYNDVKFVASFALPEQPVNIIIERKILAELGCAFYVNEDGIYKGFDEHFM